jgi:hypothetical protein
MTTTQFSTELRGQYRSKAYAAANATSPLVPSRSRDAIRANTTFILKSYSVAYATLISTKSVTSGAACPLSIHAFPDMRLLAVSPRSAPQSPSSSLATMLQ